MLTAWGVVEIVGDMIDAAAVVISAVLVVYGYSYSAKKQRCLQDEIAREQREFERRRTNYNTKLTAFGEITSSMNSLREVIKSSQVLDNALSLAKNKNVDDSTLTASILVALETSGLCLDSEGKATCEQFKKKLMEISLKAGPRATEVISKAIAHEIDISLQSAHFRAAESIIRRLNDCGSHVHLVAETTEVIEGVGRLVEASASMIFSAKLKAEPERNNIFDIDLGEFTKLVSNLVSAMRRELLQTMTPGSGNPSRSSLTIPASNEASNTILSKLDGLSDRVIWLQWGLEMGGVREVGLAVLALIIGVMSLDTIGLHKLTEADTKVTMIGMILSISVVLSSYFTEILVSYMNRQND